jgi:hypothetical protein
MPAGSALRAPRPCWKVGGHPGCGLYLTLCSAMLYMYTQRRPACCIKCCLDCSVLCLLTRQPVLALVHTAAVGDRTVKGCT